MIHILSKMFDKSLTNYQKREREEEEEEEEEDAFIGKQKNYNVPKG
jgi:hypothetical protein